MKIINLFTFVLASCFSKFVVPHVPSWQQFLFLYGIGTLLLLPYMLRRFKKSKRGLPGTNHLYWYFLRAGLTVAGMISWLEALKSLDVTHATIFSYFSPIMTAGLAVIILKEKLKLRWILALLIGMSGILAIFMQSHKSWGNLYGNSLALLSAASWSCCDLICKKQSSEDHHITQVFYTFGLSALLITPFAMVNWVPVKPTDVGMLGIASCIGIISVVALFLAYKNAPISELTPHSYLKLVFSAGLTYMITRELPHYSDLALGGSLIIVANLIIVLPRRKLRRNGI